jgi:hypothetical protein
MLADAGYAKGFDMSVVVKAADVDELAVIQYYLSKIGVNLIIDIKESGVFSSIYSGKTEKEGIFQNK